MSQSPRDRPSQGRKSLTRRKRASPGTQAECRHLHIGNLSRPHEDVCTCCGVLNVTSDCPLLSRQKSLDTSNTQHNKLTRTQIPISDNTRPQSAPIAIRLVTRAKSHLQSQAGTFPYRARPGDREVGHAKCPPGGQVTSAMPHDHPR